jgi:cathepsin A (carboxypeptidase C)
LIYVDQPVGTGFSHAGILETNEDQIAENMSLFLMRFLEKYPQLQGKDFYITGESYAGHYIPAMSWNFIFKHKADLKFNFKGMAIGNGLVDPYNQYPEYNTFAYENKLISTATHLALDGVFKDCQDLIASNQWVKAMDECNLGVDMILGLPTKPRFNVYDIREKCAVPPLCYDFTPVDSMMARSDIKTILGVPKRNWQECSKLVHTALLQDWMLSLAPKVTDILNSGLDVLVYSGDKDFICNWRGGEKWTNVLQWNGAADYNKQGYKDWMMGT